MRACFADAKALSVACVLAAAVVKPLWVVHGGVAVCALVFLLSVRGFRPSRVDLAASGLALLVVLSLQWTTNDRATLTAVLNASSWLLVFVSVRVAIRRPRDLRVVIYGLIAGCLVALLQIWRENPSFEIRLTYSTLDTRLGVEGLNYNYLAYSFATTAATLGILWAVRTSKGRGPSRLVVALLALSMYVGVLLNGTRGALLALCALAAWWLVGRLAAGRALAGLVAVTVLANLTVVFGWADQWLRENASSSARETGDLNGRLVIWPIARDAFFGDPIIGTGADALQGAPSNPLQIAAHNAVLDIGAGMGVIGVLLFILTITTALGWSTRSWVSPQRPNVIGAMVAVSTPILLTGYWTESLVFWGALAIFSRLGVLTMAEDLAAEEFRDAVATARKQQ